MSSRGESNTPLVDPNEVELWDAINDWAVGNVEQKMRAVVRVKNAVSKIVRATRPLSEEMEICPACSSEHNYHAREVRIATLVEAAKIMCIWCGSGNLPLGYDHWTIQGHALADLRHFSRDGATMCGRCDAEPIVLALLECWS